MLGYFTVLMRWRKEKIITSSPCTTISSVLVIKEVILHQYNPKSLGQSLRGVFVRGRVDPVPCYGPTKTRTLGRTSQSGYFVIFICRVSLSQSPLQATLPTLSWHVLL